MPKIEPKANYVIQPANKEESITLLEMLEESGFFFSGRRTSLIQSVDELWKRAPNLCLNISEKEIGYSHKEWYLDPSKCGANFTVVSFSDFLASLAPLVCVDCGGSGKYIGFTAVEDCKLCKGKGST